MFFLIQTFYLKSLMSVRSILFILAILATFYHSANLTTNLVDECKIYQKCLEKKNYTVATCFDLYFCIAPFTGDKRTWKEAFLYSLCMRRVICITYDVHQIMECSVIINSYEDIK